MEEDKNSDKQETRRKFLKFIGLSAGATLVSTSALAGFINKEEIRKLDPEQQEFMLRYGKWMDEFIEATRIQKDDPDNVDNNKSMMALSDRAEEMRPQLTEFMKDETFFLVYQASIERVTNEIS